jgi:hypothetical protein
VKSTAFVPGFHYASAAEGGLHPPQIVNTDLYARVQVRKENCIYVCMASIQELKVQEFIHAVNMAY